MSILHPSPRFLSGGSIRARLGLHLRDNDLAIALLSAAIGLVVGLGVLGVHQLVGLLHTLLFGVPAGGHLSAGRGLAPLAISIVPVLGGLTLGGLAWLFGRITAREIVDPVEANALYGGRMSVVDSLRLTAVTLVSNGSGGSVGLEAAYTQLGSGIASRLGQWANLRRSDLRLLVGCGAAAAIAAAFNAPLAGAFYAFELVIGAYTLPALVPVCLAAVSAGLLPQLLGQPHLFSLEGDLAIHPADYGVFLVQGVLIGLTAIAVMRSVSLAETLFRGTGLPGWSRPALGGALLGGLALVYPQVLGSGQGAIQDALDLHYGLGLAASLLLAKALAAAISLGSGFRGGLFSSSLFLGALFGVVLAELLHLALPGLGPQPEALVLVGMAAFGAAIVGAPITMVLLVLEMTGSLPAAAGVLTGVLMAGMVVRQLFGYSFATWRFHLRGVPIQGAHDVGWLRELTAKRLMRTDPKTVAASITPADLRRLHPLGGTKTVYALDGEGRYAGRVDMAHAHELADEQLPQTVAGLAVGADQFLLPDTPVRTALKRFSETGAERLPVLDGPVTRHVLGYLSEAYALRRYSLELERRRSDELGERSLYGGA
ncbi:chloride channel protein [Oleisolibacter albus]|uniref:chloride channel protein n=1 Tax=Oleisolibacter albus TaxID=2171757 RepID=UPI00196162C4|nr:chloride channel protein [Oleisolibacter albus]